MQPLARLLFIGIWNECDDAGSFEWSPLKLKMRILPADNADAGALLEELEAAGCIMRYRADGRDLGAVRNFALYQRPKKPNSLYLQTPEVRKYCGHKDGEVPNQFPTDGEKAPQMEDGGGNRSSVSNETGAAQPVDPVKIMFDSGVDLITSAGKSQGAARAWLGKARKDHGVEAVIAALGRAKREGAIDPIPFMEGCLRQRVRSAAEGMPC
ncbi:MAG: hypothetical protein AB1431_07250 [Pseudomonadota bacterium]